MYRYFFQQKKVQHLILHNSNFMLALYSLRPSACGLLPTFWHSRRRRHNIPSRNFGVMRWQRFIAYWLPPVLYLGLIFGLSSMSSPPVPKGINQDLLHYPEYALAGFLLARALHQGRPGRASAGFLVLAVALSALWGASDELHQAFVPGRVPDLLDLWHDVIGAFIGSAAFGALQPWKR